MNICTYVEKYWNLILLSAIVAVACYGFLVFFCWGESAHFFNLAVLRYRCALKRTAWRACGEDGESFGFPFGWVNRCDG